MRFIINPFAFGAPTNGPAGSPALWLRADSGVYSDLGSTPATNGGTVEQFNDKTTNGHNFTQTTAGSRPQLDTAQVNSQPALLGRVSSVNRSMSTPSSVGDNLDIYLDSTIFVVLKMNSFPGSIVHKGLASFAGSYYYYINSSGGPTIDRPWIVAGTGSTNPVGTTNYRVIAARINGTAVKHWLDGAANGTSTLANGTSNNQLFSLFTLTNGSGGPDFNGHMAELVLYNSALSDGDVAIENTRLGAYYGLF
jgi:hypothetical protein